MKALSLGKIVEFVYDNHPYARTWEPDRLSGWVARFAREELIVCASRDGKHIEGMVLFRPVMDPEKAMDENYLLDPEGACVYIDFCCAKTPEMLRGLMICVIERIGVRPIWAWERRGKLRTYDGFRLVNHVLKEEEV